MGGEGTGDPRGNKKRGIGSMEGWWWSGETQEFGTVNKKTKSQP